jgi:hypothetical protein
MLALPSKNIYIYYIFKNICCWFSLAVACCKVYKKRDEMERFKRIRNNRKCHRGEALLRVYFDGRKRIKSEHDLPKRRK